MRDNTANWHLATEFVLLFILLPLGLRFKPFPFPLIPAMWLLTASRGERRKATLNVSSSLA